jgi:hypothetical protein
MIVFTEFSLKLQNELSRVGAFGSTVEFKLAISKRSRVQEFHTTHKLNVDWRI